MKNIYFEKSKEYILKLFPEYKWRSIQNIASYLKIKRNHSLIGGRKGNVSFLLNKSNESYYWLGLIASDGSIYNEGTLKIDFIVC